MYHTETLCNTEILCNTLHDLGRRSCSTLSSCRLFLAETDTAGDSSDILTTRQEAQFESGGCACANSTSKALPRPLVAPVLVCSDSPRMEAGRADS